MTAIDLSAEELDLLLAILNQVPVEEVHLATRGSLIVKLCEARPEKPAIETRRASG